MVSCSCFSLSDEGFEVSNTVRKSAECHRKTETGTIIMSESTESTTVTLSLQVSDQAAADQDRPRQSRFQV